MPHRPARRKLRFCQGPSRRLRWRLGHTRGRPRPARSGAARLLKQPRGHESQISAASSFPHRRKPHRASSTATSFMKDRNGVPKGVVTNRSRESAMITNERQYKITRTEAEKFRQRDRRLWRARSTVREGVHPRLVQAERDALSRASSHDLQAELAEYEQLKSAADPVISVGSFDELADGLIKARIAAGLSQKDARRSSGPEGAADPAL